MGILNKKLSLSKTIKEPDAQPQSRWICVKRLLLFIGSVFYELY